MNPSAEDIAGLSLEFTMLCNPQGVGRSADARGERRTHAAPGGALVDVCVSGTTAKAQELTRKASAEPVAGRELSLVVAGFDGREVLRKGAVETGL